MFFGGTTFAGAPFGDSGFNPNAFVNVTGSRINESTGTVGTEASIGRITFSKTDTDGTQTPFQIEVNKTYLNIFPNPTGTADFTKFVQVWNNGKLQVGGEAGGTGYDGMSREPNAQLEVTGNVKVNGAFELLLGNILNTNAQWIAEELSSLGLNHFRQSTIGDNSKRIIKVIKEISLRNDTYLNEFFPELESEINFSE